MFFILVIVISAVSGGGESSSQNSSTQIIESVTDTKDDDPSSVPDVQSSDDLDSVQSDDEVSGFSYEVTDTVFHYYTNSIGSREYSGIIEITNTGTTNIYLKDCIFDLEDDNGHLLQSYDFISSCPDIIAPGEKGYFYNGITSTMIDDSVSLENGINFVPKYEVVEARGDIVDYEITDTEMREDDFGFTKITGRITNNAEEDDGLVYIQFVFKDSNDKIMFIFGHNVTGLDAGSTQSFEATNSFGDETIDQNEIATYEVIARKGYYQW